MPPPQGSRPRSPSQDPGRERRSRSRSRDQDRHRPTPVQAPVTPPWPELTIEALGRILQNNVRAVGRLADLHRAEFSQFGGLATLVAGLQAQVAALEQVLVDVTASVTALTAQLEALQQADLQQAD